MHFLKEVRGHSEEIESCSFSVFLRPFPIRRGEALKEAVDEVVNRRPLSKISTKDAHFFFFRDKGWKTFIRLLNALKCFVWFSKSLYSKCLFERFALSLLLWSWMWWSWKSWCLLTCLPHCCLFPLFGMIHGRASHLPFTTTKGPFTQESILKENLTFSRIKNETSEELRTQF